MPVSIGARLGSYEVLSLLGVGGMGEVYHARDTRLNRDVAIKVLPDLFAKDPERLARFQQEAQVLASLNHPHIAHIHELEESGGVYALVMELVEGEDLSQRIARGAIPLDEALPIARQIATNQGQRAIQQLYVRPLDSQETKPISGTEGAVGPFFSADGQWVGFFAGGKLKKVLANGGAAVTLADAPSPGGASWSSRGILALQLRQAGQRGLQQVSQEGGTPQPLTRLQNGEFIHRWPAFLPGGQALLFVGSATGATWGNSHIAVETITEGERGNPSASVTAILAQGTQPRYAPTGHLLYAQSGTLMAAPFDARRLTLTGVAIPALEGVMQVNSTGAAQYSLSSTGTLVYLAGGLVLGQSRLVWVSRNGEEKPLPAVPHNYVFPRVSPDGRRVAVEILEQEEQTWVYDVSRDHLTRLAFDGSVNNIPAWSPDSKRIAFSSNRSGVASNVFWALSDGSGGAERLTMSEHVNFPNSFSRDGQLLAYVEVTPETGSDIWVVRMADRKAQPFLRAPYEETAPTFSPDGRPALPNAEARRISELRSNTDPRGAELV